MNIPIPHFRILSVKDIAHGEDESFLDFVHDMCGKTPHVILASGGTHECSTRSLAAMHPVLLFTAKGMECNLRGEGFTHAFTADPFSVLDTLVSGMSIGDDADIAAFVAGYIAYEAGHRIEAFAATTHDDLRLPDIWFFWPGTLAVHDRPAGMTRVLTLQWKFENSGTTLAPMKLRCTTGAGTPKQAPNMLMHREQYVEAVKRIRQYIYDGDVYQVNLSQRINIPLDNAWQSWRRMFSINPAPFYAWIQAENHQVLCTSMERLFLLNGQYIETRPIKGTRTRGATDEDDERLAEELLRSEKDAAELAMIVDLERNDLGRICEAGSVRVVAHKMLERYANVQHLVSIVSGRVEPSCTVGSVFRALFPGGSVTGCPKVRAMEIIDELETVVRHVYTGAIGYIASSTRADFNIAIRTATIRNGVCGVSVGAGIVYDSIPEEEYVEILHKGRTFFELAGLSDDWFY